MKKILSIIFALILSTNIYAQWSVVELLDDFGDKNGEIAVGTTVTSNFTNTMGEHPLTVQIGIYKDKILFIFNEYGTTRANLSNRFQQEISMKLGNGEVIDINGIAKIHGEGVVLVRPHYKKRLHCEKMFIEALKNETRIKCYYADLYGKRYNFTINCVGFTKAFNKAFPDGIQWKDPEFLLLSEE